MDINNLCEFCHQDMLTNPWGCLCNCGRGKNESPHRISLAVKDDSDLEAEIAKEAVSVYRETGLMPRKVLGKLVEFRRIADVRGSVGSTAYKNVIDEMLVVNHIGTANDSDTYEQAFAKLRKLISVEVLYATDPAVNGGRVLIPVKAYKILHILDQLQGHSFEKKLCKLWNYALVGMLKEVETDRTEGICMEYKVVSMRSGKTVGYWAHGHFDPNYPYRGQPAIYEK